jgi:hypothetical protein
MKVSFRPEGLQQVINLYQEEQRKLQEKREVYSWLIKGHPLGNPSVPINADSLARVLGNNFHSEHAAGEIEFGWSLAYFSGFIEQVLANPLFIPSEAWPILHALAENMQEATKFCKEFDALLKKVMRAIKPSKSYGDALLAQFCQKLADKFRERKELWLPLSWPYSKEGSYALLVCVRSDAVTFYHAGGLGERQQQYTVLYDLNKERLEHPTFFRVLLELVSRNLWNKNFTYNEKFIITPLETYLQAKRRASVHPDDDSLWLKKPVRSHFPITKTITTAIFTQLNDPAVYKGLKFLWQTQALTAYQGPYNDYIKEVTENILRAIDKTDLPEEYVEAYKATADDIMLQINLARQQDTSNPLPALTMEAVEADVQFSLRIPDPSPTACKSTAAIRQRRGALVADLFARYEKLPPLPLNPQGEGIHSYLACLLETATTHTSDCQALDRLFFDQLAKRVLTLPQLSRELSFWKKVDEEKKEACMEIVQALMRRVVELSDPLDEMQNRIILYKLYGINWELAQSLIEPLSSEYRPFPHIIQEYCSYKNSIVFESIYQQQWMELMHFFYPKKRLDNFGCEESGLFGISGYSLECIDARGEIESIQTRELLSTFLDTLLKDPVKREALYKRLTYVKGMKTSEGMDITLCQLDESSGRNLHLACLMAEPLDSESLLPYRLHYLMQSTFLLIIHARYTKELLAREPRFVRLEASLLFDYETKTLQVSTPLSYGKNLFKETKKRDMLYPTTLVKDVNEAIYAEVIIADQALETSREMMLLSCDPYDEAVRTFAFMKKYPHLLNRQAVQNELETHIFRYGRLLSQQKDRIQLIIEGLEIMKTLIDYHIQSKNQEAVLYLFQLGMYLAYFIDEPAYKNAFLRILLEDLTSIFEKTACYKALVSVHARMRAEPLVDIFQDLFTYLFFSQSTNSQVSIEAETLLYWLIPFIPALPTCDLLNGILARFLPDYQEQQWEGIFPHYRSNEYQIDLLSVRIASTRGQLYVSLPDEIYTDRIFKKIFNGKVLTCTVDALERFYIINEGKTDELKIEIETQTFIRIIEGRECRYIRTPWAYYWNRVKKTQCWMGKQNDGSFILYFLNNANQLICQATLKQEGDVYHHQLLDLPGFGRLVYDPTYPDSILRMESKVSDIEYWENGEGKLIALRLHSSSQTFFERNFAGERRLYSRNYPGYYLVEGLNVPASIQKYLVLQNHSGNRKVLHLVEELFEYDVVDGMLNARHPLGKLKLVLVYTAIDEYTNALEILKQIVFLQHIDDYPHARPIVPQIFDLLALRDRQPMAAALWLHFLCLIEKNKLRFPKANNDTILLLNEVKDKLDGSDPGLVATCLDVYTQNKQNLEGFLLSEEQEKFIQEYLFANQKNRDFSPVHQIKPSMTLNDLELILNQPKKNVSCRERLIRQQDSFRKHFFNHYPEATQDTESFKRYLDLNSIHSDSPYYQALAKIAAAPDQYPKKIDQTNLKSFFAKVKTGYPILEWAKSFIDKFNIQPVPQIPVTDAALFDHRERPRDHVPRRIVKVLLAEEDDAYASMLNRDAEEFFIAEECPRSIPDEAFPLEHADPNIHRKLQEEQADLQHYRQSLPSMTISYRPVPGKMLKDLSARMKDRIRELSRTLKTAKLALVWMRPWSKLQKETSESSAEEMLQIAAAEYLVHSTRLSQMRRVVHLIERGSDKYIPQIVSLLLLPRAYIPSTENFENLWFEEGCGFILRKDQLNKLDEIASPGKKEVLAEIPTGEGKTKVYTPKLNHMKAKENVLIFNTWPPSLEMTNTIDIANTMEAVSGRRVDRFVFNRATTITHRTLSYLYQDLLKNLRLGIPVSIKSESLRALQLHTILFLNEPQGYETEISLMLNIMRLIRKKGWSTIDESHLTLDPFDKLIYTVGQPALMPVKHLLFIQDFVDFLTEGKLKGLLNIQENLHGTLPKEMFSEKIFPQLVEYFAERFSISTKAFLCFLKGDPVEVSAKNKPLIALAKGLTLLIAKAALQGSVNENYGLSKLHGDTVEFAIPYLMANTPKETKDNPTQYKNPHETLLKTYFTYLYAGLSFRQVKRIVEELKGRAFGEAIGGTSLSETESVRFFQTLVGDKRYFLCGMTDEDIRQAVPIIGKNKKAIYYYIEKHIHSQIKIYPQTLVSTVHNFRSQFSGCLSFSATPQDKEAHSVDTHFIPMKGTSGRVTHLLLTKCKDPKTLHPLYSNEPHQSLRESLEITKDRIGVTIDIGAYFKGLSNTEVACEILCFADKDSEVQAVVFFDDREGIFKIIDKSSGTLKPLTENETDPALLRTFYDQPRCFGSDIEQAIDAVALLMTSKSTTKAGAGQGAGRMRKWEVGQMVEVAYPAEWEGSIKSLLVHWISNQVKKEEVRNYMSLVQQMDNEARAAKFDQILEVPPAEARKLFGQHRDLFLTNETCDPWELYAFFPEEVDTIDYLVEYRQKKNSTVRWGNVFLPPKVQVKCSGIGLECSVLMEQHTELETLVEEQLQTVDKKNMRVQSGWSPSVNLFKKGWEKPNNVYLAHKIFEFFPKANEHSILWNCVPATVLTGAALIGSLFFINHFGPRMILGSIGSAAIGAGIQLRRLLNRTYFKEIEFFTLSDVFNQYLSPGIRSAAAFFSPQLLVSKNVYASLIKIQTTMGPTYQEWLPQIPLERDQKPFFSVLVIKDEEERFTVMLIDQNDSRFIREKLKEDREAIDEKTAAKRGRQIGIYDLQHNMFSSVCKAGFTSGIDSPLFWNLVGQAKFLNGEIFFQSKEEAHFGVHLKDKIAELGLPLVKTFFIDHILKLHPNNKKSFVRHQDRLWLAERFKETKICEKRSGST